jgi:hypothetical protein
MELRVFQGGSLLTLHMLLSQNEIRGGETMPLDQDVHVCGYIWWLTYFYFAPRETASN